MQVSPTEYKRQKRVSGAEDTIENIYTTVKENAKAPNLLPPRNLGHNGKINIRIIGIEESEDSQVKIPVNISNIIIEEKFPNIKKEMPVNIQEAYRTPNRLDQKNSSHHIIVKTLNAQNKKDY